MNILLFWGWEISSLKYLYQIKFCYLVLRVLSFFFFLQFYKLLDTKSINKLYDENK